MQRSLISDFLNNISTLTLNKLSSAAKKKLRLMDAPPDHSGGGCADPDNRLRESNQPGNKAEMTLRIIVAAI
jgi:hypothetical protein